MEVVELKEVKEGGLKALVRGTIKVVLLFARHIACRTGSFLCGLKQSVPPLAIFGALPGGLQWPCPTIPLCSGLRFGRWHCWGMRCCGSCGVGGGGGGGGRAIVSGVIVGERCRGRSRRVGHFLLVCVVLQGTNVSFADTCFLLLGDAKAMWNGSMGMGSLKVRRIGGAHKWAEMLHHPYILGDPQREGDKIGIGGAHKWAEMLHHPCILGDPQREADKIRIGGAHKWAEMLYHQGGQIQNWMPKPCLLGGPQVGRNPAFSGIPNKEDKVKTKKKQFPWSP